MNDTNLTAQTQRPAQKPFPKFPEMTENTFSRQWKLLQCLCESPQGLSVDEIAKEMHCGRRTVLRDLQLFRELDVSLVEETGARGKKTYRIATKPGTLSFTYDEVAAVYIGRRFLTPMMGTYFWKAMQGALKKMRACRSYRFTGSIETE